MTKLSPCPFCGGEPIDKHIDGWSWISCKDCGGRGPTEQVGHGGEHDKAWNRRTSPWKAIAQRRPTYGKEWSELG